MRFEHEPFPVGDVLDARPRGNGWAILLRNGTLGDKHLDLAGLTHPLELHTSPDGDCIAIVERYGRYGRVFQDGKQTIDLDRGDYHTNTSVFPMTFVFVDGRTLLIHGTDWNRLDASDPVTGECLTRREPTGCTDARDIPPHYLDYFHGGLHLSPDGSRIVDDGWIWHPVGEVRVWSLDAWIANPWESEDGPSLRLVTMREDWDMPLCWIDGQTIAVWGTGGFEEEDESTGIWLFDVNDGTRRLLADPGTAADRPWPPASALPSWMTFNGHLVTVSPSMGTTVWSDGGERLHLESGFAPRRYHPARREFLSWGDGESLVSRLVP